ncbi:MAG: SgcJ/EcaC family oxidoreductase [Gemmatimonadaceae bacterium]
MKRVLCAVMFGALMLTGALLPMTARAQSRAIQVSRSVQRTVARQIQPLLDEMTVAANAHDTDRFLATYLHNPDLVFVFNGDVIKGIDSVRTLQLKWWNNGKSDVVYVERAPATITALTPDVAIVVQAMQSRRTLPSGEVSSGNFAVMDVWQKRPDGWRIIQVHESTAH